MNSSNAGIPVYTTTVSGGDIRSELSTSGTVKAEDTTLSVSGLNCADTSKYFRRLAQRYRQNNSGQLKGG